MNIKDVAIIGSGIAGSTAAFHLANQGKDIIILEKNNYKIPKQCGGGISSSVQNWFPFDLKSTIEQKITKVEFTWKLKDNIVAELPGSSPFWIVQRDRLDELIINQAINCGGKFIQGFNVISIQRRETLWEVMSSEGEKVLTKAIVIADGSNSPWPKLFRLGSRSPHKAKTISLKIANRGNIDQETSRFEFGLIKNGFAWAFPCKDGLNIGIGTFIGKNSFNRKEILIKFLNSLEIDLAEEEIHERLLNVWNGHYKLDGEGVLVVGDAASLCDPFLAEGVRPGIISGYEAAKCINNWLNNKTENLNQYTQIIKRDWGDSMAWGQKIAQVFYRFPKLGYQLGIKRPTAPKRIAEILSGELSYADIAQRSIKRLLLRSK